MQPFDQAVYPFKPGDWVVDESEQIAQVKSVWTDGKDLLADLIFYKRNGVKVGRVSPIMGGPRTFEPACPIDGWERIEEPEFPIMLKAISLGDGSVTYKYWAGERLPKRQWRKPIRTRKVFPLLVLPVKSNFDPELEAKALMIAAQNLRDAARELQLPSLITRAEALEEQARSLRIKL